MLSRRDGLTASERGVASTQICERAVRELVAARVVALYATKGSEVDTIPLDIALRVAGATVVYPRIVDDHKQLAFSAATIADLAPSRFGLREPMRGQTFELADIDAFVIPGLAFDREGWRIGWGRGYYDVTLAAAPRARRIGLAFECQLVDEVAHDPHDARLHLVVTETTTYRAE
jgi:5-formyltetrahydrofolate cyclo-ligase